MMIYSEKVNSSICVLTRKQHKVNNKNNELPQTGNQSSTTSSAMEIAAFLGVTMLGMFGLTNRWNNKR